MPTVGQDGILRADWQSALAGPHTSSGKRVDNPLQVSNLPHISNSRNRPQEFLFVLDPHADFEPVERERRRQIRRRFA